MKQWYTIPNGLDQGLTDKVIMEKTTGKPIIWDTDGYFIR